MDWAFLIIILTIWGTVDYYETKLLSNIPQFKMFKIKRSFGTTKVKTEHYKIIRYLEVGIDENVLSSILFQKIYILK